LKLNYFIFIVYYLKTALPAPRSPAKPARAK
jgi:hypothetical protein